MERRLAEELERRVVEGTLVWFKFATFEDVCQWVGLMVGKEHFAHRKQVARELVVLVLGERNGAVQA